MITRVVFEFSTSTRGGPVPQRIIAAPALRGVLAFQRWRGPVEPTTGMPPEGPAAATVARGRWEQDEIRDSPPELLMALAGLLAGAPQPGKPMFMETRVETHHIGDDERGETLTINLGRITGAPFEAMNIDREASTAFRIVDAMDSEEQPRPVTRLEARLMLSLDDVAKTLGVELKAGPHWGTRARDACIKAIGDLKESLVANDGLIAKGNACAHDFYEVCKALKVQRLTGDEFFHPGWSRDMREACVQAISLQNSERQGLAAALGISDASYNAILIAINEARGRLKYLEAKLPPSQLVPDPSPCTEHAHNYLSGFATCQCGQATRTGDCRGWKTEARGSEFPPMADRYNRTASILRPYDSEGGAGMLPQMAQRVVDALEAARARIADLETVRPPGSQATERTKLEAAEMVTVLRGLHLMRRHLDEGGHDWRSGTQMSDVKAACDWLDATTTLLPLPALLTQQEWLERIRSALGVEHYSLSIKAITTLRESLANSDAKIIEAQQREISATDALREVADRLGVIAPGGPEWLKIIRDQCIAKYEAARKAEGLAVDALRTVSEAFQAVREHMGAPFIPSGPGWAEQTRDACAVAFNQVKAATYAHESLIKALGYAPGTVPWARCLKLVRETITQRNDARQEAATLASKMFDARKEVDGLRKARAYERNALHQVARALSVTPEADSTDTMDDCLKAIDRMRHLRMDAEAENRGLREKDTAIAEILTDVQKRAVMNRAGRLDDTLVFAIAEGQARYSASPHDAIRHATALAFEVRGHRQAELRAVAEREADLSRQAGCNIAVLDMAARSEGTLTNEGAIRLHRHLAACPVCRATDDFGRQAIVDDRNRWQEGKRQAEAALDAIRDHLGIRREDLSSPWVDSAKDQIIRAIDGLKEFDRKAINSARAAAQEAIRVRLAMLARNPKMAGKETASWPLESALATVERAVQRLWDEESCWVNRQPALMLDTLVERMLHDFRFLTGQHDSLNRANTEIRKMVGADSMPMTDTVTAVREALTKGAGNAAIVAAIDRLTASQAEGVALLKRLHGVADLPLQEAGMVPTTATATNITAAQIRTLHNSFCDNTATDAARRHMCRIALGECCVSTKGQHVPFEHRYPTEDEIADAKRKLASHWNGSRLNSETATPTGQPQG